MDVDAGAVEVEHGTYDVSEYADELAAATTNLAVGTARWFANDHVRVWEISLAPGERTPFHTHTTSCGPSSRPAAGGNGSRTAPTPSVITVRATRVMSPTHPTRR